MEPRFYRLEQRKTIIQTVKIKKKYTLPYVGSGGHPGNRLVLVVLERLELNDHAYCQASDTSQSGNIYEVTKEKDTNINNIPDACCHKKRFSGMLLANTVYRELGKTGSPLQH